jgi:hypothetical protein
MLTSFLTQNTARKTPSPNVPAVPGLPQST